MFDVFFFFAITGGFFEGFDDEGGSGGDDFDFGLTVLDNEFDGDAEAFPVASGFGDIVTDFLGGL